MSPSNFFQNRLKGIDPFLALLGGQSSDDTTSFNDTILVFLRSPLVDSAFSCRCDFTQNFRQLIADFRLQFHPTIRSM